MCKVCTKRAEQELVESAFAAAELQDECRNFEDSMSSDETNTLIGLQSLEQAKEHGPTLVAAYERSVAHDEACAREERAREALEAAYDRGEAACPTE